jgi:hypothetical protein
MRSVSIGLGLFVFVLLSAFVQIEFAQADTIFEKKEPELLFEKPNLLKPRRGCRLIGTFQIGEVWPRIQSVYQDTPSWCWITSAKMISDYYRATLGLPMLKRQCEIYNAVKLPGVVDCCSTCKWPTTTGLDGTDCENELRPICLRDGMPENVFNTPSISMTYFSRSAVLSFAQIIKQICVIDLPFIDVVRFTGGGGHSQVITGFDYDAMTGVQHVWVDGHNSAINPLVLYDCGYVKDCSMPQARWTHREDIFLTTPP